MKHVTGLLIKASFTLALVACAGQSSDPLKDYKDVKAVPAHSQKSETQTFEVDKFSAEIIGANESNYGNFVEGKEGSVTIKVTPKVSHIDNPQFEIVNFPTADQPKIVRISQDTYKMIWTPKAGTIPQGESQSQINFNVNVSADGQVHEVKTLFLVSRTNQVPKIKGTDGLKKTAQENEVIRFSVDVQDPNASSTGVAPKLMKLPYENSNIEAFMADASTYVRQNYAQKVNPAPLGNDTYRFFYEMKLTNLPDLLDRKGKIDPNAATVPMCFSLVAISSVGTTSTNVEHCITVSYAAQPATVTFNSADRKVIAGQANTIAFKVSAGASSVSINDKNITCSDGTAGSMDCQVSLTPSCKSSAKSQSLKFSVQSTLNKKTKITNVDEKFDISNENCEALAQAKAEADKKAKEEKAAAAKAKAEASAAAKKAKTKSANSTLSKSEKKS